MIFDPDDVRCLHVFVQLGEKRCEDVVVLVTSQVDGGVPLEIFDEGERVYKYHKWGVK